MNTKKVILESVTFIYNRKGPTSYPVIFLYFVYHYRFWNLTNTVTFNILVNSVFLTILLHVKKHFQHEFPRIHVFLYYLEHFSVSAFLIIKTKL